MPFRVTCTEFNYVLFSLSFWFDRRTVICALRISLLQLHRFTLKTNTNYRVYCQLHHSFNCALTFDALPAIWDWYERRQQAPIDRKQFIFSWFDSVTSEWLPILCLRASRSLTIGARCLFHRFHFPYEMHICTRYDDESSHTFATYQNHRSTATDLHIESGCELSSSKRRN